MHHMSGYFFVHCSVAVKSGSSWVAAFHVTLLGVCGMCCLSMDVNMAKKLPLLFSQETAHGN